MSKNKLIKMLIAVMLIAVIACCMGCDNGSAQPGGNANIGGGETNGGGETSGGDGSGENNGDMSGIDTILLTVGGRQFQIKLHDGAAANALAKMLPLSVNMSDQPHEKYYYLQSNLPTAAERIGTIRVGDVMLWGSNCLVVFYESFNSSYLYTRIGRIENTSGLAGALGGGSVAVEFSA